MRRMTAFTALWRALRGQRGPDAPPLHVQLVALPRLVVASLRGTYPGADSSRLLLMLGALAYVVSPVDVLPEAMLALVGLTDDAFVLSWLAGAVLSETQAFLAWEAGRPAARARARGGRVVPGEVIG